LYTVRVDTPNDMATSATGHCSINTRRTSMARLCGVVRAFLWMFIRLSPSKLIGAH
jgi:hypothetical protein